MPTHISTFSIARQFSFIGKTLIAALALSLIFFTLASAQSQGTNGTKGTTGEQVKVCLQQRSSSGYTGGNISRAERTSIRLQFRACVQQAVSLNFGHARSDSSSTSTSSSSSSFSIVAPTTCTPNWRCDWGACKNGWQSQTAVDSNNCGGATVNIVCPALARQCTPSTQCKSDADCPQIYCFVAPCPTNKCVDGRCVLSNTSPSITITSSPTGSVNIGSTVHITWTTKGSMGNIGVGFCPAGEQPQTGIHCTESRLVPNTGSADIPLIGALSLYAGQWYPVVSNYGSVYGTGSNFTVASSTPTSTPTQPSITVLSPNGGEQWAQGSTNTITWTSSGLTSDPIYIYVTSPSYNQYYFVASVLPSSHSFVWTVPSVSPIVPGNQYKIVVSQLKVVGDQSDNYFSIVSSASQCKADADCPTVCPVCKTGVDVSCAGPCITFKCVSGKCVANTTPSITVLSPNGGETYKNDGSPITVNWSTNNVPSSQKLDVIRLRAYPSGQEYNLAYGVLNDGHEVLVPSSVPVGAYTLEIKTYVNGTLVMDSSDSYFKIIDATTPVVSEQVKCVFNGATTEQRCATAYSSDSPLSFGCSGIGTCVAGVKGPKGTSLTWKSSCGGYAYTTLDGNSEYANFSCRDTSPVN